MANNYFRFKQFEINQDDVAMKVGTDGVLLGAWVTGNHDDRILDIGTGTGLISLMMAQRFPEAHIHAIDMEECAYKKAIENIGRSKWTLRIDVFHSSLQSYAESCSETYDLIVCNPPFYNQGYKSNDGKRNLARHSDVLPYENLLLNASELNSNDGILALIYPFDMKDLLIQCACQNGYNLSRLCAVKPTTNKPAKRVLLEFKKGDVQFVKHEEFVLEDKGRHQYSDRYKELTQAFYLSF